MGTQAPEQITANKIFSMKKSVIAFLLLLCCINCWSQDTSNQSASTQYSFGQHIANNLDHTQFQSAKCEWSIFYIFLELNSKGKITSIHFSDSTSIVMQSEVRRIVNKNEYNWQKEILKRRSGNKLIVQPVFNQLLNDCQLPMPQPTKYRGTDSLLENELATSYYVNKVVTSQLVQVSESFSKAMLILGNETGYLDCILLPVCIIKDKKKNDIKL
jgi:hypothetical protein